MKRKELLYDSYYRESVLPPHLLQRTPNTNDSLIQSFRFFFFFCLNFSFLSIETKMPISSKNFTFSALICAQIETDYFISHYFLILFWGVHVN